MRRLFLLLLLVLVGGCGYFNSLYNANRRYAEAERALRRGDRAAATTAFNDAIDKAAVSYRRYGDSRWADDALLLMGRARFNLRQDRAAIAAMRTVLQQSRDAGIRATARAYLGAALLRSDSTGARAQLDSAVSRLSPSSDDGALARLWRARALFDDGEHAAAFADLEPVFGNRVWGFDGAVEAAAHAAALQDSARFDHATRRLAGAAFVGRDATPVTDMLTRAAEGWSPGAVVAASSGLDAASWTPEIADAVALSRARLALDGADQVTALALASRIAMESSGTVANEARLLAARLRLSALRDPELLEEVRLFLLPAFASPEALQLQRQIKAVQILMLRGSSPASALNLFAAAEMLRDDVGAPLVARTLFLQYAATVPEAPWSGKALLAAHLIEPDVASRAALQNAASNVYVLAAHDPAATGPALDRAEETLARGLEGLEEEALGEAVLRDVVVGRAVSVLDSTRSAARSDSARIACGTMIDSLRVTGIRADSTRSACLRGDSVRVAFVLRADTTALVDTTAVPENRAGRAARPVPDTSSFRLR